MSVTKRIWIEGDPAYAEVRAKFGEGADRIKSKYTFPAPLRRGNKLASSPRWDPVWLRRLNIVCEELKLERNRDFADVNWRRLFRTEEARDAATVRAEQLWAEELERRR